MSLGVSIVVPTCGRPDLLHRCLAALVAQSLNPDDYEIIIVDDRPSASTQEIVASWASRVSDEGLVIRYIANHGNHGPAAARNLGWRAAHASIVAFTDDDTVPDKDWLRNGLAAFAGGMQAVWGRIEMPLSAQPTDYERDAQRLATAEFVTANCLCTKKILEQLGGFDERFRLAWREDSDFYFRLLDAGARIVHAPQALIVHPVRPAGWGVSLRQQKKILFDALLYKKHPRRYREKIRATPRWDYYLIVISLAVALVALATHQLLIGGIAGAIWLVMSLRFCLQRLAGTTMDLQHIAEMLITSIAIPPVAVFWRFVGALRFRVAFL